MLYVWRIGNCCLTETYRWYACDKEAATDIILMIALYTNFFYFLYRHIRFIIPFYVATRLCSDTPGISSPLPRRSRSLYHGTQSRSQGEHVNSRQQSAKDCAAKNKFLVVKSSRKRLKLGNIDGLHIKRFPFLYWSKEKRPLISVLSFLTMLICIMLFIKNTLPD